MSKFQYRKIRFTDWDFQNLGIKANGIGETWDELNGYLNILCGQPDSLGKWAYVPALMNVSYSGFIHSLSFEPSPQGKALREAGFKLKTCYLDADKQIMEEGRKFFRLPPNPMIYILRVSEIQHAFGYTMPGVNDVNP